jgi:acetylglutamate kinase
MKKLNVIKLGGSILQNEKLRLGFLSEVRNISAAENILLVHGGGKEINRWLEAAGIQPKFVNGLRYTDADTVEIVEMVLSGKVNKQIAGELVRLGISAVGISGKDGGTVFCKKIKNLGFVGEPSEVKKALLSSLLKNGFLPVISPLALGREGETLNVNADSMANALAAAFKADRLIFITDVNGVLDSKAKAIPSIRVSDIEKLVKANTVTGGMIPKLRAAGGAIKAGVKTVWIVSGLKGLKKPLGTVIQ